MGEFPQSSSHVGGPWHNPRTPRRRICVQFGPVRAEDLPEEIQADFNQLSEDLTKIPAVGNEGSAQATVHQMSDERAAEYARKIVEMYDTVAHREGPM